MVNALTLQGGMPPEWRVSRGRVPYPAAVAAMEARAAAIAAGAAPRAGLAARASAALHRRHSAPGRPTCSTPTAFPVFATGRGGQFTYHGPGQRVAYAHARPAAGARRMCAPMSRRWRLADRGRSAASTSRASGARTAIGVWVRAAGARRDGAEDKIAAIGIRVRRWVTLSRHQPERRARSRRIIDGIVPCGIRDDGVTSLVDLGRPVTMADADAALLAAFPAVFGAVQPQAGEPPELAAALFAA